MPAAATCSSTTRSGRICAPRINCTKAGERGLDADHLPDIYAGDQHGAGGQAGRHDDHDPRLSRQLPLHLDFVGRLRAGGRECCSASCNYDGYFLEYDTDRAGGFEPLRFLPKGNKMVVLGLVTSKTGRLEKRDDIKSGSTKQPNMSRSTSSVCRRNVASPPPRKATCWPRTSNGRSCG